MYFVPSIVTGNLVFKVKIEYSPTKQNISWFSFSDTLVSVHGLVGQFWLMWPGSLQAKHSFSFSGQLFTSWLCNPHLVHLLSSITFFSRPTLSSVPCFDGYKLSTAIASHMSRDGLSDHCHDHKSVSCTPWCHPPIQHMHNIYFYHITIFAENVYQFVIGHTHGCTIYSHFDYGCLWVILEPDMFTKHTQPLY